jgi:hypothetical protein
MLALSSILAVTDGPDKTAALAAWVQGLFEKGSEPILVGGAAIELYTRGAYTSGDLDLVGTLSPAARKALVDAGFRRQGRHWVHEEGQVFLEFPSSTLYEGERFARRRFGRRQVVILTGEDLVAERLAAWQYWRSQVDGVNAWLLYRALRFELDLRRLRRRVRARQCEPALRGLHTLQRRVRRRPITMEEVLRWAAAGPRP